MRKRVFAVCLSAVVLFAALTGVMAAVGYSLVPDNISVIKGEEPSLQRAPFILLRFDDDQAVETGGSAEAECSAAAELFGIIPVKNVDIRFVERQKVVMCGIPIGIRLDTSGVIVAETTDVTTAEGKVNPGAECGLMPGDNIISVNGKRINKAADLITEVERSDGNAVQIEVIRQDGSSAELELKPAFSETEGCYRAGIWIRSGTAGIGVLTFYDRATGIFGGLGHAICDDSSGAVMSVSDGEITSVMLTEVVRGASGAPGELVGFLGDIKYGTLTKNTETGVYGHIEKDFALEHSEYEAALKQEIEEGYAQVVTSIPGSDGVQMYDIEIEKINYDQDNPTRNMIVRVTDEDLLELTGGIVQGMSGSPIIQNGRLIGAVTHVLVNDPTSGYGIFIENMLDAAA